LGPHAQIAELISSVSLALSLRGNVNPSLSLQFDGAAPSRVRDLEPFRHTQTPHMNLRN
jgi:hypothetical protein